MLSLFACAFALSLFGTVLSGSVRLRLTNIIGSDIQYGQSTVEFFGGIPYALPPVGILRLQPPVSTSLLNPGIFNATQFGPACPQIGMTAVFGESEDCLTMNVFRPSGTASKAKLPVLVWFYGGAFLAGDAASTPGTGLVGRSISRGTPIIVVSFNYRVGPLGFPQGQEAGRNKRILNLGLQDQLAALEWVQANIATFGGDPKKVTVFGESAGATSIYAHLHGNSLGRLARGAILQSVAFMQTWGPEAMEKSWSQFVAGIPSCASTVASGRTLDCIRRASTQEIAAAIRQAPGLAIVPPYQPTLDGPSGIIPRRLSQMAPKAKIPVIIGTNLDEGTMFTNPFISSEFEIRYALTVGSTPSASSDEAREQFIQEAMARYPDDPSLGSPFNTGAETFGLSPVFKRYAALMGDLLFESGRRAFSQKWSSLGVNVYTYLFTDRHHEAAFPFPVLNPAMYGVVHMAEIPHVFNGAGMANPGSETLSRTMQDYWISFANTLNPNDGNGAARPRWPRYTQNNPTIVQLDNEGVTTIPDTYRAENIAFLANSSDIVHR